MKKIIVVLLTFVLVLCFASCGIGENTAKIDKVKEVTDKSVFENAINAADAKKENPAELNKWVKITDYSGKDQTYHNIYLRVTKVTTETDDNKYVEDAVKLHNSFSDKNKQINIKNPKLSDEGEWCVMDYEVYIPDDFPAYDGKITEPNISFDVTSLGDSSDGASAIISFGLGTQKDLQVGEKTEKCDIGKIYSYRFLYAMAKGNKDYSFTHSIYPEGTKYNEEPESINVYYKSN